MNTKIYYNAKPSKVANIGADVLGAKRMHFDTYETDAEREAKERKRRIDNGIKEIKLSIKAEILSETPDRLKIIELLSKQFELAYGFSGLADNARDVVREKRSLAISDEARAEFNKMVRAFNSLHRDVSRLRSDYSFKYYIQKMRAKYQPKDSFIEQSGGAFNWKEFDCEENDLKGKAEYLALNSRAVQFGNSVSDKERGYILIELALFLETWKANQTLKVIDLAPVSWSFGARGKANSVAYYQPCLKLVSVNRNNIGSLIHEIGHYIDAISNQVSNKISFETVNKYRESIKDSCSDIELRYYCKREEIFARAFEAYCYSINADFRPFAQMGKGFLPELNENLISVIKEALQQIV